jgi:glucose-1-phosphate thymidylyltransferase
METGSMKPSAKGIILAGGRGTRLYPLTAIVSKQLQPIYDKPMIYYPLTTLMLAGIREILLISTPEDLPRFESLLGGGSQWGVEISYASQESPRGIAEALIIAEDFIAGRSSLLMLGDNLIFGDFNFLRTGVTESGGGATLFAYRVRDPRPYAVVEFDDHYHVVSLEEKPEQPRSSWAVPGIYVYGPGVADRARRMKPSARGELEITDLNRTFLEEGQLHVVPIGRGIAWLDTGTPESLLEASNFVHAIQARQGMIIGSPEEAAYRMGYVGFAEFQAEIARIPRSRYREFLQRVADEREMKI